MRSTQTFILRLLVDSAEPYLIRGSIQSIEQATPLPFADQQSLLALIDRLIREVKEEGSRGDASDVPISGRV